MHGLAGRQNQNWNKNWQGPGASAWWEEKFDSLKSLNRWWVPVFCDIHALYVCFCTIVVSRHVSTHTHTLVWNDYILSLVVIRGNIPLVLKTFSFLFVAHCDYVYNSKTKWNDGHMRLEYHIWTAFRIEVASFYHESIWQWFDMFILRHGGKSEIRTLVPLAQWHVPRPRPRKIVERSSLRRKVADFIWIYGLMPGNKNTTTLLFISNDCFENSMMCSHA